MIVVTSSYLIGLNTSSPPTNGEAFGTINWTNGTLYMFLLFIFGLLWNYSFITDLSQFVAASCCCEWYFSSENTSKRKNSIKEGLKRGLIWNFGSIALGSFLIAVIDSIRLILSYFEANLKATVKGQAENSLTQYCISCANCILSCFERFIRFINTHAYIQIAITGKPFCKAAEDGFYLAFRNLSRFSTVEGISNIFVFVGQLLITLASTCLAYIIASNSNYSSQLHSPYYISGACFLVSFVIAHLFMSVYGISGDAILQCFCMDEEMNGSAIHAPKILKSFVSIPNANTKNLLSDHN